MDSAQKTKPLFRSYVMVDWSAAAKLAPADPTKAKDAIWIAVAERLESGRIALTDKRHFRTRTQARNALSDILSDLIEKGRVLIGFDFPFGYPAGTASSLGLGSEGLKWRKTWARIIEAVEDGADNQNNRLEAAAMLNRDGFGSAKSEAGPFWGFPPSSRSPNPGLAITKPSTYGSALPPERRVAEAYASGAETVWHVAGGAGVVGSQVLLGLPTVWALRTDPRLAQRSAIWPFETGLQDDPSADLIFAEIWPSLLDHGSEPGLPKDATQVKAVVEHLALTDDEGHLGDLMQGPPDLNEKDRTRIEQEEAWILGLQTKSKRAAIKPKKLPSPTPIRYEYETKPSAIYEKSFQEIADLSDFGHLPDPLHPIATRIIHACGQPEVAQQIAWSGNPVRAAEYAFSAGKPIFCDVGMLRQGIIPSLLPNTVKTICTLNRQEVFDIAERLHTTRSAAATELWGEHLSGAVVAIGNAPTALFHLLEGLSKGWPLPSLIIGMPVGFVGAAESKQALIDFAEQTGLFIPYVTVTGRLGGSAIAAAAVNACLRVFEKSSETRDI